MRHFPNSKDGESKHGKSRSTGSIETLKGLLSPDAVGREGGPDPLQGGEVEERAGDVGVAQYAVEVGRVGGQAWATRGC